VRIARAFTLIEVVVALVVVLVLAAVALPNVTGYLQQKRVDATQSQLAEVVAAVTAFEVAMNTNPGRLSELSTVVIPGNNAYNTGTDDSCGNTFSNPERDDWLANGPFIKYLISRDVGMVTPIGIAHDSLTRNPPTTPTAGTLRVNFVNSVALEDAILIDQSMNAGDGNAAGSITWTMPAIQGLVTMYYTFGINNRC
jgi:prepilin-type N-terminal cleavage/methylation domain-containing protein